MVKGKKDPLTPLDPLRGKGCEELDAWIEAHRDELKEYDRRIRQERKKDPLSIVQ